DGCAAAEDPSEVRALPGLVNEIYRRVGVAELGKARLHGDGDRSAHLDGSEAVGVIQKIHHGDLVHVADAAVTAMRPDGLVLGLLGEIVAVLVIERAGTLDDAAAVASVGRVRPALLLGFR